MLKGKSIPIMINENDILKLHWGWFNNSLGGKQGVETVPKTLIGRWSFSWYIVWYGKDRDDKGHVQIWYCHENIFSY